MFTSMFFYLFICLLLFGIGDVLGVATKAKVSAVFVSLMLFLVGFMTGVLPPDIIKLAGLTDVGKWSLIFVVFSMGTSLNIKQLIAQTHQNVQQGAAIVREAEKNMHDIVGDRKSVV